MAVDALGGGRTVAKAAELAGVTTRQVHRWNESPEFREAVQALHLQALEMAEKRLASGLTMALDAIQDVITEPDLPGQNVKRLAAVSWVELALKVRELSELERRITELEAHL